MMSSELAIALGKLSNSKCTVRAHIEFEDLVIDRLVVIEDYRCKGIGTQAMRFLCHLADSHGLRVVLTADENLGASSKERLVRFYERFGLRLNQGDRSTLHEMIRPAKRKGKY